MGPCSDNCLNNFAKVQFLLDKRSGFHQKKCKKMVRDEEKAEILERKGC
jgi:hypothetical protein